MRDFEGAALGATTAFAGLVASAASIAANRANARALDANMAGRIRGAAASAHARVASDRLNQIVGAELRIEQLEDKVDALLEERSTLFAHLADLLTENQALRARRRAA